MQHVNDPVPSVRDVRPDVPSRLDWAVQTAMAKDHDERFDWGAGFAAEREACHEDLDGNEGATVVVPPRTRPRQASRTPTRKQRRWSIWPFVLLGVGLAAVIGALAGAILLQDTGGGSSRGAPPPPNRPGPFPNACRYDPFGGRREHHQAASGPADGNNTTPWMTEHYSSFTKQGVGIVVGASSAVSPKTMSLVTDTPGFTAEIKAGDTPTGPFHTVAGSKTIATTEASFGLSGGGRYFL